MEYQLIRSARRKTIALQVKNAKIIVRAPNFVKVAYIDNLIQLKSLWLKKKLAQQQNTSNKPLQYQNNSFSPENLLNIDGVLNQVTISFGTQQVLHDKKNKSFAIFLSPRYRHHDLNSVIVVKKVKLLIEQWFKAEILDYLALKLPVFSEQTLLHAESFKVRKYKARWGSCSSRGELSFNCLLKMLPPWVVDYVIVHELCHLKYMNHSTKFWQLVEKHYPDFHLAKNWLKQNQISLVWD